MSDSFFGFSTTFDEGDDGEMDETAYDALNYETFGETADTPSGDWEELHERMTRLNDETTPSETKDKSEKKEGHDEKELEDRLADLTMNIILDDESEDPSNPAQLPKQQKNDWNGQNDPSGGAEYWPEHKPEIMAYISIPLFPAPLKKIPTVTEIESALPIIPRTDGPTTGPVGMPEPQKPRPIPQVRPSPLQPRNPQQHMQQRPQHPAPPNPNHLNGDFAGPRGGAIPRRPRPEFRQEDPYNAPQHLRGPQFRQPNAPNAMYMPRGSPRNQGQRYLYDPRMPALNQNPRNMGNPQHRPQGLIYNPHPNQPQQQPYGQVAQPQQLDEYAGLMSSQEKQWLASIQMMQLNTHQPYQDDYYYTMYQQRHGNSRKLLGAQGQKRESVLPKAASTYKPLQFENSLGKLQIGSVTAPRKIIDMVLVEKLDPNTKHQNEKKNKAILLEIESMYDVVLKIEDVYKLTPELINTTVPLQERLLSQTVPKGNEEKIVQIMAVRKGRGLVLRMLHLFQFPSELLHLIMKHLSAITRKDAEGSMLLFLPAIRNYLQSIDLKTLVEITTGYDNMFLLSNKFAVSVVANIIERADQIRDECTDEAVLNEWNNFLIRLLEATRKKVDAERPVVAVDRVTLLRHLIPVKDQVTNTDIAALLLILQPASTAKEPAVPSPPRSPTP